MLVRYKNLHHSMGYNLLIQKRILLENINLY